jgi:hypothetical protein
LPLLPSTVCVTAGGGHRERQKADAHSILRRTAIFIR